MAQLLIELVEENIVAVTLTTFLILFIKTNNNFEKRTNQFFLAAASCVLVLIVEEAWEARLAMGQTFTPLRTLLSAIGYTLRPMTPYFLILAGKRVAKWQFWALTVPLVFNGLVAFSSLFCGISFGYTMDNEFVRGPLGYTPFVVAALYIAVILVFTLYSYRGGGFSEAMIVSAIALLAFFSTVLESLFGIRFIQNPCIAISINFYYLFLHSNQSNRDSLTGALTRRRFYLDAGKHTSSLTAVISLDLNDLKTLNDQHGHIAGDQALMEVSAVIKRQTGSRASLYRTGGDEFMMLCYRMDERAVEEMIGRLRADLEKTPYRCAIGYALCTHQMYFDQVCQVADGMMYEDKRRMKAGALPCLESQLGAGLEKGL